MSSKSFVLKSFLAVVREVREYIDSIPQIPQYWTEKH